MFRDRKKGRRANRHGFRPTLDGRLETRALLSKLPGSVFLRNPKPGVAFKHNQPPFLSPHAEIQNTTFPRGGNNTETAHGGQTVYVATAAGHFAISLTQFIPPVGEGQTQTTSGTSNVPGQQNPIQGQVPGGGPVQPIGTVRAYNMPGGRIGIIVDGSTTQTELDISPLPFPQKKGFAHSFAYGQTNQSHILNVGAILINSGTISAVLGYHTANLSGPLIVSGTNPVDRIAFQNLLPGASIITGGDLNTLDILQGVNLNSGPGIHVGRDLNLLNVGQDLDLSNGASLFVGRFLGTNPQPPKGTATGSNLLALNQSLVGTGTSTVLPALSGYVQGNLNIGAGSTFTVTNGIANSSLSGTTAASPAIFLVNGSINVSSAHITDQIIAPASNPFVFSTQIPATGSIINFVARGGANAPP